MPFSLDRLLDDTPLFRAALVFLVLNLLMCGLASALGVVLYRRKIGGRIQRARAKVTAFEVTAFVWTVALNTLVTTVGLALYRAGVVKLSRGGTSLRVVVEVVVFMILMDAFMYALHRLAHVRRLYFVHRMHHGYDNPTALSLFALHPLEALGFGGLWIVLLCFYPFSIWVVVAYTALNLTFGIIGHLGVEVFPRRWARWPIARFVTTSTFHNQHHESGDCNFGFYTTIWDELFGTMHPDYAASCERNATRFFAKSAEEG